MDTQRPRIWTLFAFFFAGFGIQFLVGILAIVPAFLGVDWSSGAPDASHFESYMAQPEVLLCLMVGTQLGLGGLLALAVAASPIPWRDRLGVRWGNRSLVWLPLWIFASLGASSLASRVIDVSQSSYGHDLSEALAAASLPVAVLFVALGSLLPAVIEELVFRGFFQQRLQRRYSGWLSVGLTGVLFAVFHADPLYILAILPLGIWLSFLAWKVDGIVPGMVCHWANNAVAFAVLAFAPGVEAGHGPLAWAVDGVLIASLVAAVAVLLKRSPKVDQVQMQLAG